MKHLYDCSCTWQPAFYHQKRGGFLRRYFTQTKTFFYAFHANENNLCYHIELIGNLEIHLHLIILN